MVIRPCKRESAYECQEYYVTDTLYGGKILGNPQSIYGITNRPSVPVPRPSNAPLFPAATSPVRRVPFLRPAAEHDDGLIHRQPSQHSTSPQLHPTSRTPASFDLPLALPLRSRHLSYSRIVSSTRLPSNCSFAIRPIRQCAAPTTASPTETSRISPPDRPSVASPRAA